MLKTVADDQCVGNTKADPQMVYDLNRPPNIPISVLLSFMQQVRSEILPYPAIPHTAPQTGITLDNIELILQGDT